MTPARFAHGLSTAAADPGMSTALRSVGFLDVLSSTPVESSRRAGWEAPDAPRIHARLRRLATKSREKSGLGSVTLLAIFLAAGTATAAAQFKVASEEVRIDVLVTERGKPVAGLKSADFEVADNGVRQEIRYVTLQKQAPISATLVFDMSRSVAGRLLINLKDAAGMLLSDLKKDDYAALITFSNAVTLGAPPIRDFKQIELALDGVKPLGNSSLIDGSYAGLILAGSRPEPPLLIIFSDGLDTFSWLTEQPVLEAAKRNDNVVVYAVSTSRLKQKGFLRNLTEATGGKLIEVESTGNLAAVFRGILEEFRQRYLLTYIPQGVSEGDWHKVDIRVKNPSFKVSARPGYMRTIKRQ